MSLLSNSDMVEIGTAMRPLLDRAAWIQFACAQLSLASNKNAAPINDRIVLASRVADEMLIELNKRFKG